MSSFTPRNVLGSRRMVVCCGAQARDGQVAAFDLLVHHNMASGSGCRLSRLGTCWAFEEWSSTAVSKHGMEKWWRSGCLSTTTLKYGPHYPFCAQSTCTEGNDYHFSTVPSASGNIRLIPEGSFCLPHVFNISPASLPTQLPTSTREVHFRSSSNP